MKKILALMSLVVATTASADFVHNQSNVSIQFDPVCSFPAVIDFGAYQIKHSDIIMYGMPNAGAGNFVSNYTFTCPAGIAVSFGYEYAGVDYKLQQSNAVVDGVLNLSVYTQAGQVRALNNGSGIVSWGTTLTTSTTVSFAMALTYDEYYNLKANSNATYDRMIFNSMGRNVDIYF